MLRLLTSFFFILALLLEPVSVQSQNDIRFDSCAGFSASVPELMENAIIRTQIPARWNASQSINQVFDGWLRPYIQKSAGGQINLSLLIFPDGSCCLYRIQPNSNVRPNFLQLRKQVAQLQWLPAYQNNTPVLTTKVLQLVFSGKTLRVIELQ